MAMNWLAQPLLVIGCFLIAAAVVLAFLQRSTAHNIVAFAFLGVICCVVGVPHLRKAIFKGVGIEASFDMADQEDIGAIVAPINAELHELKASKDNQIVFNKAVESRLDAIEAAINLHPTKQLEPNIGQTTAADANNSKYIVLLFYRDGRETDAETIRKLLIDRGFALSSFNSSLNETTVQPQTPGSTFVAYTERGKAVNRQIELAIKGRLASGAQVNEGGPYPMRRGDIQIYLY